MKKKPTVYRTLIRKLAEREGGLREVSVGNLREVTGLIAEAIVEDTRVLSFLLTLGQRRRARRK